MLLSKTNVENKSNVFDVSEIESDDWMALFGCRELINIGGGFVAIAR